MTTEELLKRAKEIATFMEDYHTNVGHNHLLSEKSAQLVTIINQIIKNG